MTAILVLLCLAIAGLELYLAFERRRPSSAPELADIRTRLSALGRTRDDLTRLRTDLDRLADGHASHDRALQDADARIRSLIAQINERVLPEVTARLTEQRETVDRLAGEVARLRGHLVARLDQAVAASLGADPVDTVAGTVIPSLPDLADTYERFARHLGLGVELRSPLDDGARYYLSGRSPRALERDFFDLLNTLRDEAARRHGRDHGAEDESPHALEPLLETARRLLACLGSAESGGVQLGPLVVVRDRDGLLCGVLSLAELRHGMVVDTLHDLPEAAAQLRKLPQGRFCRLPAP
ncbi:hypothetical protein Acsp04_38970 [Actinomadura sp. NBRC 104425]|uniref:hypothetical protein n=1 Tax=Actinomadura sp. NBRC 104425 TaxID=3032204 RepID=UPI0024A2DD46|nr:hypothetical protein [Actinomadura sp. NBRC 104425]GLZ13662.1 hypothetical protein Acsp04_38970 [Actinomadura sp. NBRC 104425]